MTNAEYQMLLEQLSAGKLDRATGALGLEAAGLLGQGTRAYSTAVDPFVRGGQDVLMKYAPSKAGGIAPWAGRLAGSGAFRGALRTLPAIGALGGVMGAADVLAGPNSAGNKIMDGTAMTIGGMLGSVGGPVGVAAGAGGGKMVSDGLQWLFGDKKNAEQRRMEEALMALRGGVV